MAFSRSLEYPVEFVADDGRKIVEAVLEKGIHPDLILMDYHMPVFYGRLAGGGEDTGGEALD